MAKPIHEIMAESSAGMANARRFRRPPNTPPPGWSPRPAGSGRGFFGDASQMGRDLTSGMVGRRRSGRGIVGDASQMGRDLSGIMNPVLRRPAVGNTAGRRRWTPGSTGRTIFSTPEENENNRLSSGLVNTLPGELQMAKVYGIGDEGMINDPWYGSPRLSDEANAINQALDFARKPGVKSVQGISPSTLRGALGNELYKKNPEMYRNMLPRKILNQLPADAFETQDDWLNQQPITMI